MKTKTLPNVVLHQDGGFRFGLMNDEFVDSPVESVCVRNLIPGKELNLPVSSVFVFIWLYLFS